MKSDYVDMAYDQWDHILTLYHRFQTKRLIMLFDVQEQKVYAYPYKAYKATLSSRDQTVVTQEYEEGQRQNKIVMFVRDNVKKKLVSFLMDTRKDKRAVLHDDKFQKARLLLKGSGANL